MFQNILNVTDRELDYINQELKKFPNAFYKHDIDLNMFGEYVYINHSKSKIKDFDIINLFYNYLLNEFKAIVFNSEDEKLISLVADLYVASSGRGTYIYTAIWKRKIADLIIKNKEYFTSVDEGTYNYVHSFVTNCI